MSDYIILFVTATFFSIGVGGIEEKCLLLEKKKTKRREKKEKISKRVEGGELRDGVKPHL